MGGRSRTLTPGWRSRFSTNSQRRKIRIDDDILAADLHEKAGMPDESHAQIAITDQFGFVRLARCAE